MAALHGPTRLGVALEGICRQDLPKFHFAGWKGGVMTQALEIAREKTSEMNRPAEFPPTWVLLDLEEAIGEAPSDDLGRDESGDQESKGEFSSYVAVGWGSSL